MDKLNTTIIGLGLIGGSIALDLKNKNLAGNISGFEINKRNANQALRLGLIDDLDDTLPSSNLVILAVPVNKIVELLPEILWKINNSAVVIDTGSTKSEICRTVASHPKRNQFVAAHPIAGTENSGPEAAFQGLFKGKMNIICEKEKTSLETLQTAEKIFEALGMKSYYMRPEEHDKHVAYVSHLSHVSSFLLGQTVLDIEKDEKNIFMLAGSGFASTVRLAKSSPEMWAPIFEQNMEHLSMALQEYIIHLQRFQYHLMKKNTKELLNILKEANSIRTLLRGFDQNKNGKRRENELLTDSK